MKRATDTISDTQCLVLSLRAMLGSKAAQRRLTRKADGQRERGTARRLRVFRDRAAESALIVASSVGLAAIAGPLGTPLRFSEASLNVMSVVFFGFATVLRLGWPAQSIGGDTRVERADAALFKALFWLGTYSATAAQL